MPGSVLGERETETESGREGEREMEGNRQTEVEEVSKRGQEREGWTEKPGPKGGGVQKGCRERDRGD